MWATSEFNGTVSRIDPATNAVTATIKVGAALSPKTLRVVARVKVSLGPGNAAIAGDGTVFVPNTADGTVSRIDPVGNKVVAAYKVGPKPFPAAAAFGDVWVPLGGGRQVVRFHVG